MLNDSEISRILVINAHPDDVDFGAAGTVACWTEAGIEVTYCVVTDGDAGGSDPSVSRPDMAVLRRAEQTAAAKQVGVHDVRFLGYPDGRVEATIGLRRDLARVIRQVRPDRVVCPSPERNYLRIGTSHPDHRAVGSASLDAVYPDARNPFAFPDSSPMRAWMPGPRGRSGLRAAARRPTTTWTSPRPSPARSLRCARTQARSATGRTWKRCCAAG